MINLLSPESKAEIRAGRVNRLLVRYIVLFGLLMLALFAALGIAYYLLHSTDASADRSKEETNASFQQLASVQKEVDQFTSDLATSKQILDKQVNYSTAVLRIASAIPSGVVISRLELNQTSIGKPMTIAASAKNEQAALALKQSLSESQYFSDPHFEQLTIQDNGNYPVSIILSVTLKPELLK